jgi:hypothetical protein
MAMNFVFHPMESIRIENFEGRKARRIFETKAEGKKEIEQTAY